ncbi:MAG TPA: class I SAM-dependent methyltransferase [Blastocatellia bacterium]|nr:class I SAM-dependent methyltransferase [Blastocatellia bacterium]
MSTEKELAYRYDLFIASDWRDRFDILVNDNVQFPVEGSILDINCGTGGYAVELAQNLTGKGEVIGLDSSKDRVEIARAKALAKKLDNLTLRQANPLELPFPDGRFDLVIGDSSLPPTAETAPMLKEMIRVARHDAQVILKMTTAGSFDEFFSIYWEALATCGLADQLWQPLESLIKERHTISEAEDMAAQAGLNMITSYSRKEEFACETALQFLESPLILDVFLAGWLGIVPETRRLDVVEAITHTIEQERHAGAFEFSIKATAIAGRKMGL